MVHAILNILVLAAVIFIIAQVLPSIKLKSFGTALLVGLVYSVIHFLLYGLFNLLVLPMFLVWITFGLAIFVINAFLLWLTDILIDDFEILGMSNLVIASGLMTIASLILKWIF